MEDSEEEAVEEDAGDEGDDRRDDEEGVRRVDDVDDLECHDADKRCRHEGTERLRLSKLEDEDVADEHGDDAFDGDDGEELLRCVEHDGEATGGEGCCDRLIEVGVRGLDVDVGDVPHARDEDGKGDAEGQAADDEHGVHGTRHARCRKAIQHVTCCVDGGKAGHEEDGARNECIPHCPEAERGGDRPCEDGCDKARNHGTGIGVKCVFVAETVCNETHECRDGSDERLLPAAAKEFARAARADGGAEGDAPVGIAERTCTDARDGMLNSRDGRVAAQDAPCELADGGEDGEVDAVFHAFAELGEGAFAVADVEHERGVGDVGLDVLGGDAQMHRRPFHVANDACTVRPALHQGLSNVQQELHLVVECFIVIVRHVSDCFAFHVPVLLSAYLILIIA